MYGSLVVVVVERTGWVGPERLLDEVVQVRQFVEVAEDGVAVDPHELRPQLGLDVGLLGHDVQAPAEHVGGGFVAGDHELEELREVC